MGKCKRILSLSSLGRRLMGLASICFLVAGSAHAEVSEGLSFGGPEVLKLDWATRSMKAADINGDGLSDFALINNDRAKIEIYYQRGEGSVALSGKKKLNRKRWEPVLEDARFEGEGITIGYPIFDLAVGDLNGDGRADLAYTSRETPLTIRFQSESGSWTRAQEFDSFESLGWRQTIEISDLNNDGANELVVISGDAIRVFSQADDSGLSEPELYYLTGENPFNLIITDVTGDGLSDLLYVTSSGKQSLALRQQSRDGAFGPEYRFTFERPVRFLRAFDDNEGRGPLFSAVDSRAGTLEFFRLEKSDAAGVAMDPDKAELAIYPIVKEGNETPAYTIADLSGKGNYDMLVANPATAELIYYPSDQGAFAPAQVFPSFAGVSAITAGRFHQAKGDSVVLVSQEEKVIGLSQLDKSGRIGFPKQFFVGDGDPIVCSAHDFDGDGYSELALIVEEDGERTLTIGRPSSRKNNESDWEVLASLELGDMRRSPSAIVHLDIFESGREGLVVFVPREAPILISIEASGDEFTMKEFAKESSIRDSLLKGIGKAQLSAFDIDGDGQNELIAGRSGYARALRATESGLEMVDQFNALRSDDEVSVVIPVSKESKSVEEIIFYVGSTGEFQYLERDEDGVFRYQKSRDIGALEVQDWFFIPTKNGLDKLILASVDSVWSVDGNRSSWVRSVVNSYETELEDVNYSSVNGGVFNTDEGLALIAVDGSSHVVELLSFADDAWQSTVYWEIFEQNLHYQGRTGSKIEPREIIVSDFTGDGKLDFSFLIHDRILLYPQQ